MLVQELVGRSAADLGLQLKGLCRTRHKMIGQSAIKKAIEHKKAIVIAGAIVLIAVFYFLPALATGLLFGVALFSVNTLVDGKMGGQGDE